MTSLDVAASLAGQENVSGAFCGAWRERYWSGSTSRRARLVPPKPF